jgi:hypothetical protein
LNIFYIEEVGKKYVTLRESAKERGEKEHASLNFEEEPHE